MVRLKDYTRERHELITSLERQGIIRSRNVKSAMLDVPRELFAPDNHRAQSYIDAPLPLGGTGQTISAPHMVAMMLEELDLSEGLRVLEIGCGSGYNAACLARMVGTAGKVVSLEVRDDLVEFARQNLVSSGFSGVEVHAADGAWGWPKGSRDEIYERIVLTAGAREMPSALTHQLRRGGVLLAPLGEAPVQQLTKLRKSERGELSVSVICDCIFVPLIEGEPASP